ncbi:hypothetical protein ABPG75_007100 [Micractinium tetrahymenae]
MDSTRIGIELWARRAGSIDNQRSAVRKWHFEIPGFDWPDSESHPRYPTGQECQQYIERYAEDAGLRPFIKFGVTVTALKPQVTNGHSLNDADGSEGWVVESADEAGAAQREIFDFVVVATGLFNQPVRPEWAEGLVTAAPPKAADKPWVVDVKDFTDDQLTLAKGKRVVIVGAGKSAHDVGLVTSRVAASTTLVARRGHWMAPQKVLGFLPLEFATYTRWSWALQPAWYTAGALKRAAHTLFSPVKAAAWGLFGLIFTLQNRTPSHIKPEHGLLPGIYDTIGMVDSKQLSAAFRSGRLAAMAARIEGVEGKTLRLSDGSTVEADIVVLATGYRPIARTLFPTPELQEKAGYDANEDGSNYEVQWLYRHVLPPALRNIAFIGQLATFQHVLTAALQSRWLAGVADGSIPLPPLAELEADVARQRAWWERFAFPRSNNYIWALHGKYHDQVVRDIKGNARARSLWNPVGEYFGYVKNQLYAPLFPAHVGLRSGGKGAGKAAKKAPASGTKTGVTAVAAIVA